MIPDLDEYDMTITLINQKVEKDNLGEYVIVKLYNQDVKDLNSWGTSFINRRSADEYADDAIDLRSGRLKESINNIRKIMNPS